MHYILELFEKDEILLKYSNIFSHKRLDHCECLTTKIVNLNCSTYQMKFYQKEEENFDSFLQKYNDYF